MAIRKKILTKFRGSTVTALKSRIFFQTDQFLVTSQSLLAYHVACQFRWTSLLSMSHPFGTTDAARWRGATWDLLWWLAGDGLFPLINKNNFREILCYGAHLQGRIICECAPQSANLVEIFYTLSIPSCYRFMSSFVKYSWNVFILNFLMEQISFIFIHVHPWRCWFCVPMFYLIFIVGASNF